MSVTDEAAEAAAEWLPHSDDCEVRPERDCTCWQQRVDIMRAALEAAAPHMLAEAWDKGRQSGHDHMIGKQSTNPYRPAHEN